MKINRSHLESAPGLRIAIVPTLSGKSDAVRKDDQKNLLVCPLPHDFSFMQTFYEGMRIVQALVSTDFNAPKEPLLPDPNHREVARIYVERRDYSVKDVIEATAVFAQPHLLEGSTTDVAVEGFNTVTSAETTTVLAPFARLDSDS